MYVVNTSVNQFFFFRYIVGEKVQNLMKQMSPEHYHRQVETPCHAISNVHMEHFLEINGQDQGNLLRVIDYKIYLCRYM